jgi:undecaprenyl-diphosphatase
MNALNLSLFHWLAAGTQPTPWVLSVALVFALWGSWLCAGIVAVALWRRPADRIYLCVVMAMAGLTSLGAHTIATALNVSRPFVQGLAPAYISHAGSGSLPSTHASVMFMVAVAFMLRPGLRRLSVPLLALAAATGWARVYVGVHFPVDIVAGLLLGTVIAGAIAMARWLFLFFVPRAGRASGDSPATSSLWRPS